MTTFPYSKHVSNPGLHIDSTLFLNTHIAHMYISIHYHLHCFRLIRRSIPFPIDVNIESSYILPLFDYCNNLLFNLPTYKQIKLQSLQTAVVRCVHLLPSRSSDSIIPLLKQIHWIPVSYRITYKLSLTIHKAIHHNYPDYLASLLHLHTPTTPIHTRSSNTFILTTPHLHNLLPYTLICPICPLSLELHTLPPSNNDINLLLQTSSKDILFLPCFPPPKHNNLSHGRPIVHD